MKRFGVRLLLLLLLLVVFGLFSRKPASGFLGGLATGPAFFALFVVLFAIFDWRQLGIIRGHNEGVVLMQQGRKPRVRVPMAVADPRGDRRARRVREACEKLARANAGRLTARPREPGARAGDRGA